MYKYKGLMTTYDKDSEILSCQILKSDYGL